MTYITCFGENAQALGLSDDFLDKAIELAKKGWSQQTFLREFTKYVFMKKGIKWK